jgi:hypothetical protein
MGQAFVWIFLISKKMSKYLCKFDDKKLVTENWRNRMYDPRDYNEMCLTSDCSVAHICMYIRYLWFIVYADGSSCDVSESSLLYVFPFLSSIFTAGVQQSFMSLYQFTLLCKKLLEYHHKIEW